MKKFSFLVFLFVSALNLSAQSPKEYEITEAQLKMTLPNNRWHFKKHTLKTSTVYHFKRDHHHDVKDTTIKKLEIVVIVENVRPSMDASLYSVMKIKQYVNLKKYKVEQTFTKKDGMLQIDNAVGYKASYQEGNGSMHTFFFIHAVNGDKGIQVVLNVPSSLYKNHEEELAFVIRSLKYKE